MKLLIHRQKKFLFCCFVFILTTLKPALAQSSPEQQSSAVADSSPPPTETYETLLDDGPDIDPSPLTGNIKIVGRQMLVDGKLFVMKGICYNPVRKGATHPEGLITLNPTEEDLVVIEKDFQMMHAAGINTIRTYEPLLDQHILDLLVKYELRTIVPVLNAYDTPFGKMTNTVSRLKDHPSTLIWEVGNEWNYNGFYSGNNNTGTASVAEPRLDLSITLLENAAHYVRLFDTVHPISTAIGDFPKEDSGFWQKLRFKGIDLYAMNVYDWLSFGDRFSRWAGVSNKPLYISEFGTDAFNDITKLEDDASQAYATGCLIREIQNNLSANNPDCVLIGGCLFEWNDEFWKGNKGDLNNHAVADCGVLANGAGPYPDHSFREDWFDILDIDRNPRAAYDVIKNFYLQ